MKLGVFTVPLGGMSLDEACAYLASKGVQMVEIGCGGCPGKAHCDPEVLLNDDAKCQEFLDTIHKHGLEISALSAHGNMVHPDPEVAAAYEKDFTNAILLAEKLGVSVVNTFSGCPGGGPEDKTPNWVTCPWPDDFSATLEYQWNEVLIPYWKKKVAFAKEHGVHKIALELHPGFCVYNTKTLLKLREAVGPEIGANFDPSHLIWQGIDPAEGVRLLGGDAIHHVHAKDTHLDRANIQKMGVMSTTDYGRILERPWTFRTVGYGTDETTWKEFISMLRLVGYDGTLSIEHEDSLMSVEDGLEKAIQFLQNIMTKPLTTSTWWTD